MTNLDGKNIEITKIIKRTMEAIAEGKKEIFEISEASRKEYNNLKKELEDFQVKVKSILKEVELLEQQEQISRKVLLAVSRNFATHTEEDIRRAYETANQLQIKLVLKRQEEKELIKRRSDLEIRLKNALEILNKSENLISKVSIAFDFLSGDLKNITDTIEDLNYRSSLGSRIIQAQEEERQRIARDIHDGPAQTLTNSVIKTELCEKLMDVNLEEAKYEIKELKKGLRESIRDIRSIIYNLHPMALNEIGFIPTVQRYASDFQMNTNIQVDLIVLSKSDISDSAKTVTLFRIVQEALNNIRKHSQATVVKIKVEMTVMEIHLVVEDNGVGFNIEDIKGMDRNEKGFGILNMQERIDLLDGKFEIKSKKDNGTKIIVSIPNER